MKETRLPELEVRGQRAAARSWPSALGLAAATVYVPQLVPLAATDLAQHEHCLGVYTRTFPVLAGLGPGVFARIESNLGEPWEEVVCMGVAALVVLAMLAGAALALRRWQALGTGIALGIGMLSGALSMFAVAIIRA